MREENGQLRLENMCVKQYVSEITELNQKIFDFKTLETIKETHIFHVLDLSPRFISVLKNDLGIGRRKMS